VKIEAVLGHSGEGAAVEVVISVPRGSPIVCRSTAQDLHAAVDLVLDKAEIQLTKHKERIKDRKVHKGAPGDTLEAEAASGQDDTLESYDDVIEKRDF
jgi:ribosome-associated translation inhibitor RaiA